MLLSTRFHTCSRRAAREEGAVLVQFAIVLPLLIMLTAGVVDYGTIIRHNSIMISSARAGARAAATFNGPATQDWFSAIARDAAREYIVKAGLNPAQFNFAVCNAEVDVDADPFNADLRRAVRVTVATTKPRWFFSSKNATAGLATSTFAVESSNRALDDCV